MKRGDTVRICAGWMADSIGYVESVDGEHALVLAHGTEFPFPRCQHISVSHLRRVDLAARADRAARESVGEAPF